MLPVNSSSCTICIGPFSLNYSAYALLCLGNVSTAIAFWAVFSKVYPEVEDDEDGDGNGKHSSYRNDVADALRDLGELGFMTGYLASQTFLADTIYRPLMAIGLTYEENSTLNGVTLAFVLAWMLMTKLRDYSKAAQHANESRSSYVVVQEIVWRSLYVRIALWLHKNVVAATILLKSEKITVKKSPKK